MRQGAAQLGIERHLAGEHNGRRHGAVLGGGRQHHSRGVRGLYVEKVLSPKLRAGQVLVMDDLSAHKGSRVRQLIEERGCKPFYLPPYSPDFNPIEQAFSKVKGLLRRAEARTREALVEAMGTAHSKVTAQDARGFFGDCGYRSSGQLL